jgi:DNA-binding NarL/FixJ family response regulator
MATGSEQAPRVVIADDQTLVRGRFRLILHLAGIPVVAEAADGKEAVAAVLKHRPDVVLMDIRMPEMDGLEATRRILESRPGQDVRVIMLTTFDLDQYVYAALAAGASGFLLKDVSPEHLVAAVRLVPLRRDVPRPDVRPHPARRLRPDHAGIRPAVRLPAGAGSGARGRGCGALGHRGHPDRLLPERRHRPGDAGDPRSLRAQRR